MADAASSPKQTVAVRPKFTPSMRSSSSYLSDHQQYRPRAPEAVHQATDKAGEERGSFKGIPCEEKPPRIVESGVTHEFSHPNCTRGAGASERLVATLFYKAAGEAMASQNGALAAANMAPTRDMEAFPLEPPAPDAEQLDHLYGSFISPLCITSFLHLMSTFPQPREDSQPHSSHRCLDSQDRPRVVELVLAPAPSTRYLTLGDLRRHEAIFRFEREWSVDVALQRDVVWRRHPRLVVFDMDSTLITQEVIELLADMATSPAGDLAARVASITQRAMQGEIEFEASFRERVALLRGLDASLFEDLRARLEVTPGARQLIAALKRLGVKTAVVSGGFEPLTQWLAGELGLDHAFANRVAVAEGKLTGQTLGAIVGKERKRDLLLEIAAKEGIHLEQVVAIGDGANDLLMLDAAGLGVAWRAKPRVQMEADVRLNGESMLDLLYLFGFTSDEIDLLVE
ncbi:hypothetical protein CDD81_1489 [Ophiocordyceps australis]|uniref:phosphoserine phosphatase n=1 Tax=Ophiocordyceps australis TaxID=1399860 RepID=A0A2C5YEP9_9HYPO|nr:hypothetical protein CDD81_1489 [Ophiocordyceps australis]